MFPICPVKQISLRDEVAGGEGRAWTRDKHTTVLQLPHYERRGLVVVPIFDMLFH
jgi:hypothetical protein